jgi:hypothetical protein
LFWFTAVIFKPGKECHVFFVPWSETVGGATLDLIGLRATGIHVKNDKAYLIGPDRQIKTCPADRLPTHGNKIVPTMADAPKFSAK